MNPCGKSAWGLSIAVQHWRGATLPIPSLRTPAVDRPEITLIHPTNPEELEATREIFVEYAGSLDVDLDFQGFEEELAELPGEYAAPRGHLVLALVEGAVAGCCALRPIDDVDYANACEMKRLYVRKAFRGFGLGRQLVDHTLTMAAQLGYDCILLDTLDSMESARALYADFGFEEIPPYYHNPIAGTHYLKAEVRL
ncbi:putative acetyltransferase [Comamonas sp. 4034]